MLNLIQKNRKRLALVTALSMLSADIWAGNGVSIGASIPTGGNTHDPTFSAYVRDKHGRNFGGNIYGPNKNRGGESTWFPDAPTDPRPPITPEEALRERVRREQEAATANFFSTEDVAAKASFSNWGTAKYRVATVDDQEYHIAHKPGDTFGTLSKRSGWTKVSRSIKIGYSTFENQPSCLTFEKTPLCWHFKKVNICGIDFINAYTDTCLDILVKPDEHQTICAPAWYVKQEELKLEQIAQQEARRKAETAEKQARIDASLRDFDRMMNSARIRSIHGYLEETFWGTQKIQYELNHGRDGQSFADQTFQYYERARQMFSLDEAGTLLGGGVHIPGGFDNLQKFHNHQINATQYKQALDGDASLQNLNSLRDLFKSDNPNADANILENPLVFDVLASHRDYGDLFAKLVDEGTIESFDQKFMTSTHQSEVTAPVTRSNSWDDLSHVANVDSHASGLSFSSLAAYLTQTRYKWERLKYEHPDAYEAALTAIDLKVKAGMTYGAVKAVAAAPETEGLSLLGFGAALGAGMGLEWAAEMVLNYGADIAAINAAKGDLRLQESYRKTFKFVGDLISQHGLRAGLKGTKKSASTKTKENALPNYGLRWTSWRLYPKVQVNGVTYAKIGDRIYTEHAVGRMLPSGLGRNASCTKTGMSISPNMVEDVIRNGSKKDVVMPDGTPRAIYSLGTVEVCTENNGHLVVTVNTLRGKQ